MRQGGMKEKQGADAGEGAKLKKTSKLVNQPAAPSLVSVKKIKHICMSGRGMRNVY